jgi:hypothetical protein
MKGTAIVIAIVVFGILILGGFGYLKLSIVPDTTGHSINIRGVMGGSVQAGAPNDALDATSYVTAWQSPGLSEKIVTYAQFKGGYPNPHPQVPIFDHSLVYYWFVVSLEGSGSATLNVDGANYVAPYTTELKAFNTQPGSTWVQYDSPILKISGPFIGKIHVDLWAKDYYGWVDRSTGYIGHSYDNKIYASDEAELKSGIGSVSVPAEPIQEGTNMVLKVTTGYSHSAEGAGGWTLLIFNNKGVEAKRMSISDGVSNYEVIYLVPAGSFDSTPGANNNWKIVLRNELFDQSAEWVVVIRTGSAAQIPPKPTIQYVGETSQPFDVGEVLLYQLSATKNPLGNDISGFRVSIGYSTADGSISSFIVENQFYAATLSGTVWAVKISFTAPQAGYYKLQANTIDTQNLGSGFSSVIFGVETPIVPGGQEPPPGGGGAGGLPPKPPVPPEQEPVKISTTDVMISGIITIAGLLAGVLIARRFGTFGIVIGIAIIIAAFTFGLWRLI